MHLITRTESFVKLFFLISCTGLFMYVVLAFYTFHTAYTTISQVQKTPNDPVVRRHKIFSDDTKYILVWTATDGDKIQFEEGYTEFHKRNCSFTNCFFTMYKRLLGETTTFFDAIIFTISTLRWKSGKINPPKHRSPKQKFIFYGMESSEEYPICNINADNYFNWTWSYKLYSDIFNPFIEVRDLYGNVVAPYPHVEWLSDISTLTIRERNKIKPKKKALAWIVNNCRTRINRLNYAKELQRELKEYSLVFDIYGCGELECPNRTEESCLKLLEKDYYFYLAHEDSFAEDYVTTEVLKAYNHDAIPIVMGGAEYGKFLPDGSYINGIDITIENLAAIIDYTLRNPSAYYSYFQWKKHYMFRKVDKFEGICELCAFLNDQTKVETTTIYTFFRKWWYTGPLYERCIPKGAENISEMLSYVNKNNV